MAWRWRGADGWYELYQAIDCRALVTTTNLLRSWRLPREVWRRGAARRGVSSVWIGYHRTEYVEGRALPLACFRNGKGGKK